MFFCCGDCYVLRVRPRGTHKAKRRSTHSFEATSTEQWHVYLLQNAQTGHKLTHFCEFLLVRKHWGIPDVRRSVTRCSSSCASTCGTGTSTICLQINFRNFAQRNRDCTHHHTAQYDTCTKPPITTVPVLPQPIPDKKSDKCCNTPNKL